MNPAQSWACSWWVRSLSWPSGSLRRSCTKPDTRDGLTCSSHSRDSSDWPSSPSSSGRVQRELAWLRLKTDTPSIDLIPMVERYAIDLERHGEWKKAAEVYAELSQGASPGDNADYYRNCVERLREHLRVLEAEQAGMSGGPGSSRRSRCDSMIPPGRPDFRARS